jgi:adenosylcobinamide-GDP ribazoletransferase
MLVFLPAVGLVIGLIWYGLYLLMARINIPLQLQIAALMLYPYLITGFIHLDGFMDTSDALLSRRPLEDKLRILKDPHTGAFAVISVAILFIICYASMSSVMEQVHLKQALDIAKGDPMLALIFIPVITRCCSAAAVLAGKPLAHSQYVEGPRSKKPVVAITAVYLMGFAAFFAAIAVETQVPAVKAAYSVWAASAGALAAYLVALFGAVR